MEVWKDIKGYEGLYHISNLGRVKTVRKNYIKKLYERPDGYTQVCLCKKGKVTTRRIHILVAKAFIPNPLNLPEVNHKDENKTNNCVDNLEWCNTTYNKNYRYSKL